MEAEMCLAVGETLYAAMERMKNEETFGKYRWELTKLMQAVGTANTVLSDLEGGSWVGKLREALYDGQDLVDDMVAGLERIDGFPQKIRWFCFDKFVLGNKVNSTVERIDALLKEAVVGERGSGGNCKGESLEMSPELELVIGRDADKSRIVDMLCDNTPSHSNAVVAIVGMGGLGKTALARHIYHDECIAHHFPLKLWATVSKDFDVTSILLQFQQSASAAATAPTLDHLTRLLHGKRFLVVLDDVWNECAHHWHALAPFLPPAAPLGSKCLVTTRSVHAAASVGDGPVYHLPPLSDSDSWKLFHKLSHVDVNLGKSIVSKCAGVPLAIRLLATSLHTSQIDRVLLSLKPSYDQLSPPLKLCFTYCALFPKDHCIDKESLIQLWLAQGFVSPHHGRTPEDVAEEYFLALVHRCFFQEIKLDSFGGIRSCKMHSLLHDLASSIAGRETSMATPFSTTLSDQTRHLSVVGVRDDSILHTCLPALKNIRTYLDLSIPTNIQGPTKHISCLLLSCAIRLRVLDVCNLNISSLPDKVCQMPHLRYLNLSGNSQLEVLPGWITQLYNLQTLNLSGCLSLKKLPCDMGNGKLVKLRHLDIRRCNKVSHMPQGFSTLTSLQTLSTFVVGLQRYSSVPDQLEVLKSLCNLKGSLTIKLPIGSSFNAEYLKSMIHLKDVSIQWSSSQTQTQTLHHKSHEALFQGFEPHCNMRSLEVVGYPGVTFPSWAASSTKMVNICLDDCPSVHHLPRLSQLPQLKGLVLHKLGNLENMESACSVSELPTFFPSLENLTLSCLPKLRGWWSVDGSLDRLSMPLFPRLCQLKIMECPKLVSIPPCHQVEDLNLYRFNDRLQLILLSSNSKQQQHRLPRRVTVDNVQYINHLPLEFHQLLSYIDIHMSDLEVLSPEKEVFTASMGSLQSLHVTLCSRLTSLSGLGWRHLTSLHRLKLSNLPLLDLTPKSGDGEGDVIPWHSLQNLHHIELDFLPKLVELPEGIRYLTALKSLEIRSCHNLKALPEWISCLTALKSLRLEACTVLIRLPDSIMHLTSLENLEVLRCSGCLREKCQQLVGEDWSKIRHISHISIC